MVALMVVMVDEGFDLGFKITRQEVVFQQDAVLQVLMPTLDLAARFVAMRYLSLSTVLPYSMRYRPRCWPYTGLSVSINAKILA